MRTHPGEERLLEAFETCSLPPEEFGHAEHLQVGWEVLAIEPLSEALTRFSRALRRFAAAAGGPDKYHETITWFYLLLLNERRGLLAHDHDWETFRDHNSDLFGSSRELLSRYYSADRLSSDRARREFLLPDLLPCAA